MVPMQKKSQSVCQSSYSILVGNIRGGREWRKAGRQEL